MYVIGLAGGVARGRLAADHVPLEKRDKLAIPLTRRDWQMYVQRSYTRQK